MLGIPADLNTPIFAISRIAGWCAHRLEEIIAGGRIIRPAYKCVQPHSKYVEIEKREAGLLLWLKKILKI
jgi:citrate synthase